MRIYFDTEFTNLDASVELDMISSGFVAENGRELYLEITDFDRKSCSDFVEETVLPLLENRPEFSTPKSQFTSRLLAWLESFDEEITLASDARCDWSLLNLYAEEGFKQLKHPLRPLIWERSPRESIQEAIEAAEAEFWEEHPGLQHHALYDAKCLMRMAGLQRELLTMTKT